MDPTELSERMRRQLEGLPPEKRARAEAALARTRTPEFRARVAADREILAQEYRETGTISTTRDPASAGGMSRLIIDLRRAREAMGLSLADAAERSGIDKAALSRLENGQQPNPTVSTLERYASALGKRLSLTLEEALPGANER